jgi:type IV pilus assembly protein PilA
MIRSGFTLVEAMVTVAITGILLAIAIPNYKRYQMRSMQTEAKSNLTSIHTVERAFFLERGTFTSCIKQIGFDPGSTETILYYGVGFPTAAASGMTCGIPGNQSCLGYTFDYSGYAVDTCTATAGSVVYASTASATGAVGTLPSGGTGPTKLSFQAGASGVINPAGGTDSWTIDQNKSIINTTSGL